MLLRFDKVHLKRGGFTFFLDRIFPDSGMIGLAGPNGSGKSTLMDLATSIVKPSSGIIYYDEDKLSTIATNCFPDIFSCMYAGEEPFGGFSGAKYIDILSSIPEASAAAAERFPVIRPFLHRDIRELSRGQWVSLLLSSLLIVSSRILFIDEYMLFLDPYHRELWTDHLKDHAKTAPVFIITHETGFLYEKCDNVLGLKNGREMFWKKAAALDSSKLKDLYHPSKPCETEKNSVK